MSQHVCTDDCLRNVPDVKSPFKGASEAKIDVHRAPRVDRYRGTIGGMEAQDRRKVPVRSRGGENTDIRASVNEEPDIGVAITNMEQR